jgi:hypothetical protein
MAALLLSWLMSVNFLAAQDIVIEWPQYSTPRPVDVQSDGNIKTVSFTPLPIVAPKAPVPLIQAAQLQPKLPKTPTEPEVDFKVRTQLPEPDLLFRRESEEQALERIRQENTRPGAPRVIFPEKAAVSKQPYEPRDFPQTASSVEPGYVAHRRLFFEQPNFDRHLWDVGYLTPYLSAGKFFYDTVLLPYHCGTEPLRRWDASAGKCLPGDDTPLYCYGEKFSVTGLTFQVFSVAGGILIFP